MTFRGRHTLDDDIPRSSKGLHVVLDVPDLSVAIGNQLFVVHVENADALEPTVVVKFRHADVVAVGAAARPLDDIAIWSMAASQDSSFTNGSSDGVIPSCFRRMGIDRIGRVSWRRHRCVRRVLRSRGR